MHNAHPWPFLFGVLLRYQPKLEYPEQSRWRGVVQVITLPWEEYGCFLNIQHSKHSILGVSSCFFLFQQTVQDYILFLIKPRMLLISVLEIKMNFPKAFTLSIPYWTKYPKQHFWKIVSSTSNFDHEIYWLLHTSLFDDPETRYKKLKKTASQFLISQFGKLCIVALCFPSASWLLHSIMCL